MRLENDLYMIQISIDTTYTVDSIDNRHYDIVLNPANMKRNSFSKTLSITVTECDHTRKIALIGDFYSYDDKCAILDNSVLSILQNNTITQIELSTSSILSYHSFECFGCCFAIYNCSDGYIINGEIEIIKLNYKFEKVWSFSGADIFITQDNRSPFEMTENKIKLYDWNGIYYELDFDGNLLKEDSENRSNL
jgi:hypothetical protein